MPGLILHFSNRTEILVDGLADLVRQPLRWPFESELIIVQSQGMAKWLSQQLALRLGIWTNCRYLFPNRLISEIFSCVLGEDPDEDLFSQEILQWRILRLLPQFLQNPEFASLKGYLEGENSSLKQLQLADQIANVFDHYTIYRPDLVCKWEKGKDAHWQSILWRTLNREAEDKHQAAKQRIFFEKLRMKNYAAKNLPSRLSVFGISFLPTFHLDILAALPDDIEVHVFFMNPTLEYWGEILSEREQRNIKRRQKSAIKSEAEEHFETGNPLLASFGKLGREFFGMLLDRQGEEETKFSDPGESSLLRCIQSDIFHLRTKSRESRKKPISSHDDSIQIHSCHNPMREMEVLHDRLLSLLEKHPELEPHDILVMAPDIETYAPFIQAVFDAESSERKRIPFTIADRSVKSGSLVIQAFLKLLLIAGSRVKVSQVVDLLDVPFIYQHFGISSEEIPRIRHWIEETRIRWGLDASARIAHGLPDFPENTWETGLNRMILGYALSPEGNQLFDDILPINGIEGSEGQILGRFMELIRRLFHTLRGLTNPKSLSHWSDVLLDALDALFEEDENHSIDFQFIRNTIRKLNEIELLSGFNQLIDLPSLRYYLGNLLAQEHSALNFIAGGVTFCAMLPMRTIPFRVIGMVGMNHDNFPRRDRRIGFDLVAVERRPGDRSLRDEDRYLFLEAILSAREYLYLSYIGQSAVDNTELPPSVVVSELIDVVNQEFQIGDNAGLLPIRHPLQPFSPAYFSGDSKLFSYSKENCEGLKARDTSTWKASAFISEPIQEPGSEWKIVELQEFLGLFQRPTEFFFRRRLGIDLQEEAGGLEDSEPFSLDSLDDYSIKQELTLKRLKGVSLEELLPYVRAQGILPPQRLGEVQFQRLVGEVESFTTQVSRYYSKGEETEIEVEKEWAGFQLRGTLRSVCPDHLLRFRCAKVKPRDRLAIWIEHLLLNLLHAKGYPSKSVLVSQDGVWSFQPVREPERILQRLLEIYWQGLVMPLHFFPKTSWEYADAFSRRMNRQEALRNARQKWVGNDYLRGSGENQNPYNRLGFRNIDPLDEDFEALSLEIFGPLIEHERREGN